ncbi:hypothetical protein ACP70R_023714 [Stipagrostis hirtigluma subsp. patula]
MPIRHNGGGADRSSGGGGSGRDTTEHGIARDIPDMAAAARV